MDYVDIRPATVAQVHQALKGQMVFVSDDVQGIASSLKEIDESLGLHYDPQQDIWVVTQSVAKPDGSVDEKLVTSQAGDLDHRLLNRVRVVTGNNYDFTGDIEAAEAAAERKEAHDHHERVGPVAERLLHALRHDLGYDKDRAFVPGKD